MKKLTTSVLSIVLTSACAVAYAQDSTKVNKIDQVVITGALGIKKTADAVTNAQQIVGSKELNQAAAPNAVQSLNAKVSGLTINTTNTSVDSTYRIVLRGNKSITGNNQALVVIDNVISNATVLANLPSEVIENINIIKGLQGAALYGQQGVNGVIVVTTKRGSKSEKLQLTLTSSIEATSAYKIPLIQKRYGKGYPGDDGYSNVYYGGTNYVPWENTFWGPAYDHPDIKGAYLPSGLPQENGSFIYEKYAPIDNHYSNFFRTGFLMQNGVTASIGGSDGYASFSYNRLENDFVVEGDQQKRNSFLLKAGKKIEKFRIDGQLNYINTSTSETDSSLYNRLLQTPSNNNIRLYRNTGIENYLTAYATNPYWTIEHNRFDSNRDYISGILSLEYKINKNINVSYTGNLAITSTDSSSRHDGFKASRIYRGTGTFLDGQTLSNFASPDQTAYFFRRSVKTRNYYGDLMVNFDYDLTDDIGLKFNIGNNIQDTFRTRHSEGGIGLTIPGIYNISNVTNPSSPGAMAQQADGGYMYNDEQLHRVIAGFANVDLSYKNYLFLNGTFRMEQSSTLSTYHRNTTLKNQVYPYYSAGISFIPTKMLNVERDAFLNYVKIAPSFTRVGNTSAISPYATDQILATTTGYPFGSLMSYMVDRAQTRESIQPEFVNTMDLNVQLGFLNDRITLEGSIYQSDTDKMITTTSVSRTTGLSSLQDNVGKLRMRGFEVDLGITPIKTKDITWNLKAAISHSRSRVLELSDGVDQIAILSYSNPGVGIFAVKGEDFAQIKGTTYVRNNEGKIVVDANGAPIINSQLSNLGRVTPDYILNFNTNLRFKGFTLSAAMDYRKGGKFVSFTKRALAEFGALEETANFDRSQGYVIPNSVQLVGGQYVTNTTPYNNQAVYEGAYKYFSGSSYLGVGENFLVDATSFKLREVSLSYDFPKSLLRGSVLNSATIGVFARNPLIIYANDNRNYADPETSNTSGNGGGISTSGQYPTIRSFGMNLRLTF